MTDDLLRIKMKPPEIWRCPKGHVAETPITFVLSDVEGGPYCPQCLNEWLDANVSLMMKEVTDD